MPNTVANSGSAKNDGSLAIGVGQASRAALRSTDSATSRIPGSREAPPLSTNPAMQCSRTPAWRRLSRSNSKSSRARLQNFARQPLRHHARGPVSDRRHLNFIALRDERRNGVAKIFLERLRVRQPRTHADREIAGEVAAADRNDGGVRDCTLLKNDQIARAGAEIDEANAKFAFVRPQHRVGASERLKDGVIHVNARPVHRSYQ